MKKRQKFSLWRQKFMACLSSLGVEIEEVSEISSHICICICIWKTAATYKYLTS